MANLLSTTVNGSLLALNNGVTNAYTTASNGRLYLGSNAQNDYSIYTHMENFGGNYTKLTLDWHTGIKIGASQTYGGIRFYGDAINNGGVKLFSVGEGDAHVRVENNLYVGNTIFNNGNAVIHTGNIGSQSVASASQVSGVSVSATEMNRLKTTLGVTGLPYSCDIFVEGDPDTYYPVHFIWGDQDIWRRIIIKRGYSEQAPWDPIGTGVHHGGLLIDWEGNFGGWGGAEYSDRLRVFQESYTTICADMYRTTHSMGYTFFLRGGGAVYHIYSDQNIRGYHQDGFPDIAYDTNFKFYDSATPAYIVYAPAPLTTINSSRIDGLRTKKQSQFDGRYQQSGTAINTGNIGSQSVNYAASAGNADTVGGYSPIIAYGSNDVRGRVLVADPGSGNISTRNPELYSGEVRLGAAWDRGGVFAEGVLSLSTSSSQIDFVFSNTRGATVAEDGNIYMSWAGAWLSTLLDAKQNASTAINTGNIGSQSVSYANNSGNSATTSQRDFSGDVSTSGMGRFAGWYTGNAQTGLAAEIGVSAGQAYIIAYNRQSGAYGTLNLESTGTNLRISGSTVNVTSGTLQQGGNNVIHAGNIGSQSVSYATSAGNSNNTSQIAFTDLKGNFPSGSGGGHSFAPNHYSMGLDVGNGGWDHPHYRDLIIGYHTGVRIGANYSGIRFYNNSPTTDANNDGNGDGEEALLMTIGGYVGTASQTDVVVNNNLFANGSMRAPIFYDSDNTNYYLNPAGGSRLRNLYVGDSGDDWSDPGSWGTQVRFSNEPHVKFVLHARTPGIEAGMYVHTPGSVFMGSYTAHVLSLMYAGNMRMQVEDSRIYSNVYMESASSMRAPIFYDSADTGYYLDPNGTSNLLKLSDRTMGFNGMNPMSANSPYEPRYNASVNYRTGSMGYGTVGLNAIGSNWGSGFIDSWSSPAEQPNTTTSHWVGLQSIHYGHQDSTNFYGFQMVSGADTNRFYLRAAWPTPLSWVEVITSGNIGSQSVNYASSAGAVEWSNVSSKPSTFAPDAHNHTPTEVGLSNLSSNGNALAGNFTATGDITAYSDSRIKENVATIDSALDKVMSLRGVEYNKIGSEEKSLGVIAQEIREVLPEVVKEQENGMLSVAYGNITAVLIEALKEQQKQIDELKAQIDAITK